MRSYHCSSTAPQFHCIRMPPARQKNGGTEALGRSRVGLTTKLHVASTDEHSAVALTLIEGQRHDSLPLSELIEQAATAGRVVRVTADRAYDGDSTRLPLLKQNIELVIPASKHRKQPASHDPGLGIAKKLPGHPFH